MKKLEGKVAIVTGATSGIGQASAELFAQEGAKVVAVGRNVERGANVIDGIKKKGGEAIFVAADLQNLDDIDKILNATISEYGKLDILFYNAGIIVNAPFEQFKVEDYDKTMNVNVRTPFVFTQKALPHLLKTKGNALYTASAAGHKPSADSAAYNISKSSIIMLAKALGIAYADKGVRFNSIAPGLVETSILAGIPADIVKIYADAQPMKRLGRPEELARAALFLVSDDASFITGTDLLVDGANNLL